MKKALLASFLILTFFGSLALASRQTREDLRVIYPVLKGTRIDKCLICHLKGKLSLNPYGEDLAKEGDFKKIEPFDSDKDGFTNLEEIEALTFPGDPEDYPTKLEN